MSIIGVWIVDTFGLVPPAYRGGPAFRQGFRPVQYVERQDMPPENQSGNNVDGTGPKLAPGSSVITPEQYNNPFPTKPGDKVHEVVKTPEQKPYTSADVDIGPINAAYAEHITRNVNESNAIYRAHVGVAREKNRNINPSIFDDIQKHNEQLTPWYADSMVKLYKVTPNGDPPSPETLNPKIAQLHKQWEYEVRQRALADNRKRIPNDIAKADAEVNMAFNAVAQELPTGGMGGVVDAVTKSVYDKEKGGVRLGGVIGGIAGFMLGGAITGGQGFFGIIAGIVMAAVGAYVGNKFMGDDKAAPAVTPANGTEKPQEKKIDGKTKELEGQRAVAEAKARAKEEADRANKNQPKNNTPPVITTDGKNINMATVGEFNAPVQMAGITEKANASVGRSDKW